MSNWPSSVEIFKPYLPGWDLDHLRFDSTYPMGNWVAVIVPIVIYLATIFSLQKFMENRKRYNMTFFVVIHNAFLCLLSLVMLTGSVYECLRVALSVPATESVTHTFLCDENKRVATGPQIFWFYIFFLSKFYELLDTVIICFKKNKIIFLHVYHHCITVVLMFVMLDNEVTMQWMAIIANCAVHVPMYYYYAVSSLGVRVWWKKYITTFQIMQFIADITVNTLGFYTYYSGGKCSGSLPAWWFGQFVLLSFLVLFIIFFNSTYNQPQQTNGQAPQQTKKTN